MILKFLRINQNYVDNLYVDEKDGNLKCDEFKKKIWFLEKIQNLITFLVIVFFYKFLRGTRIGKIKYPQVKRDFEISGK
ncbi:hypothetical protein IW19_14285 [Flavobacterium reichenbachii]|uniref:Uncharacterized protein n=1 Tax=Flavobacterium reichenbachii TaxID=362418 RepID=A0A085ZQ89_9FLAO|nr:hypothetical protein IW19_14285 [Flavobacterium reichenbachii]